MKKNFSLFLLLLVAALPLFSQKKEKIASPWLLTRIETPDGTQEPWLILDLTPAGKLIFLEMEMGTWSYDRKDHILTFTSEMNPKLNGDYRVDKLDSKEMITVREGMKFYYTRLDTMAIAAANRQSPLPGMWEISREGNSLSILKFALPDDFTSIDIADGTTDAYAGTWIWDPGTKEITLISMNRELRGKNKAYITGKKMTLTLPSGEKYTATKMDPEENAVEHLTFSEDDFPEESDSEGLPPGWQDMDQMVETLKGVKELHYRLGRLIPEAGIVHYTPAISRITLDTQKPSIRFTNLTVAYGDTSQYSEKYKGGLYGMYDLFFPENEIGPFRVAGTEKITVPAGTFACTVVEGMDGDTKVKYWMITDKPGIYARIIRETPDPFDDEKTDYTVKELTDIR